MAKYKVQPNETWSTIAQKFKTTVQQVMGINKGVTTLTSGMGIMVPQYQYSAPRIGATGSVGGLNAAQSNARAGSYDNNLTGYYNDAYAKPPTSMYPNILAQQRGAALPQPTVTGRGTGNFAMNFQTTAVGANPSYTSNPNYRGYGGVQYERDPVTGRPAYNYIQQRDSNGNLLYNADGSKATTPASMYNSDIVTEARRNGQSVEQFTADLKANGYTQFGGAWVYVAPPRPQVDYSRPLRNANGNLVRRREPTSTPIQFDDTGTASTNFGVGAG